MSLGNPWADKSECNICGAMITSKNLNRHIKDVHFKNISKAEYEQYGRLRPNNDEGDGVYCMNR